MQQALMESNLRNSMQHVNAVFKKVSEMPEWRKRMGIVKVAKK